MRKYLIPIIVAGLLCGNLAICETQRQDLIVESDEINDEIIEHYEDMIRYEERKKEELLIIKEGYRKFLLWTAEEFFENDPEARKVIEE